MKAIARLHRWRLTLPGLLIFGLVELAVALAFASRAMDTGSLIEYFLGLVFLVAALQNLVRMLRWIILKPMRKRGSR